MNLVVYAFQRVGSAAAIINGVVAERRPSMHTRQKIESLCYDVVLEALKLTLYETNEREILGSRKVKVIRYQTLDVSGRIRAVRVIGTSYRRLPGIPRIWEIADVVGIESVLVQRVRHFSLTTVRGPQDGNSRLLNDLGRWDGIGGPIPVRCSQGLSCIYPALFIPVIFGNFKSVLLHHLL
jgi:hypothetical protein